MGSSKPPEIGFNSPDGIIILNVVEEVVVLLAVALDDVFVMVAVGPYTGREEVSY